MKRLVVHPFFFASYAVLALLSYNTLQNLAGVRGLIASISISSCVLIIFLLITKDIKRAGLISSVFILLIFSYGHVIRLIQGSEIMVNIPSLNLLILLLWFFIPCVWTVSYTHLTLPTTPYV